MKLLLTQIVCSYLRWRYGGDVHALKPPLGFHPLYSPRPWWRMAAYRLRYFWWRLENTAFQHYGQPMRDNWNNTLAKVVGVFLLLCALPASAIIIEDSNERLVWDVTWNEGPYRTREEIGLTGGGVGEAGSIVQIMGQITRNQWQFFMDIRRMVDGVFLPTTSWQIAWPGGPESFEPVPDRVLGSPGFLHESQWVLAIPGNPHGARLIRGLPYPDAQPVPEGEDSLIILTFAGALIIGMLIGRTYGH